METRPSQGRAALDRWRDQESDVFYTFRGTFDHPSMRPDYLVSFLSNHVYRS